MNRIGKIAVVVVLLAAVGIVIALKRGGGEAGVKTSRPATGVPCLVDFGASKCVPCKMMAPILEELKEEFAGRLDVQVFDVDENPALIGEYGIRLRPTQIFYDASGKELDRHEGFMSREDILAKWKELGVDLSGKVAQPPEPSLPASRPSTQPSRPKVVDREATTKPAGGKPVTVLEIYPRLASGGLTHAGLADLPKGVILRSDDLVIRQEELDKQIAGADRALREQLRKNAFFLLEQSAGGKLLLAEAKRELAKAGKDVSDRTDQSIIAEYFGILTENVRVTDSEIKEFYDGNKNMVGGASLDKVRPQIRRHLLGEKKREFMGGHVKALGRRVSIEISASWVKAQAALAKDNPVDKARDSGRPSLVDFGAVGCQACDMMTPILADLKKKHDGKLNVVIVHVREEQILAARYGVRSIPVQIFFDRDGKEVFRHTGFLSRARIDRKLTEMGVR